jgi:hypothetical protein
MSPSLQTGVGTRDLETPRQLGDRVGLSKTQVNRLICQGRLGFVVIGARKYIPTGAWDEFIRNDTRKECQDTIKALASTSYESENVTTSSGLKKGAASSAALARQTARQLKLNSLDSLDSATAVPARVIPLKF